MRCSTAGSLCTSTQCTSSTGLPSASAITVRFDVLQPEKRPVMADADGSPVEDVHWVEVQSEPAVEHRILFDPGHGLEERLIREQFQ